MYANRVDQLIIIRTLKKLIVIIEKVEQLIDRPSLFYPFFLYYEPVALRESLTTIFLATRQRKLVVLDLSSSPISLVDIMVFPSSIKKIVEIAGLLISSDFLSKIAIVNVKSHAIVQTISISSVTWSNQLYDIKAVLINNVASIITLDLDLNLLVY